MENENSEKTKTKTSDIKILAYVLNYCLLVWFLVWGDPDIMDSIQRFISTN